MGIEQSIEVILGELSEVKEILQELRSPQKNPEPADRCQLKDACEITGLSKAAIYKLTHEKKIEFMKFGSRLVFSRRKLAAWVDKNTLPPSYPEDELNANLVKSAKKHLRNGK